MKKLAIISPNLGAQSETFIRRHMQDLLPGRTVVIACKSKQPYSGHWSVNCPTLALDQVPKLSAYRILNHLSFRLLLKTESFWPAFSLVSRFLKKNQIDVIMGEYLSYSFPFFRMAQKLKIPYYAHAHGADISVHLRDPEWRKKYLEYNQASGIISVSQLGKQRLTQIGIDPSKIHVIPCGVDVPECLPTKNQKQSLSRCLAVGRFVPKKAPIKLLEAFMLARERRPEMTLDVIGGGPLFSRAQDFVTQHGLAEFVTLHGSQPAHVVKEFLAKADIFIQHSVIDQNSGDEEGLPVAILEAMASGLPVVATKHAGIPEAVMDQQTGYLVNEGDTLSMAAKIVTLADHPYIRHEMGAQGWAIAREKFSWNAERSALLDLMQLSENSNGL